MYHQMSDLQDNTSEKGHVVFREFKETLLYSQVPVSWIYSWKDSDETVRRRPDGGIPDQDRETDLGRRCGKDCRNEKTGCGKTKIETYETRSLKKIILCLKGHKRNRRIKPRINGIICA